MRLANVTNDDERKLSKIKETVIGAYLRGTAYDIYRRLETEECV